MLSGFRWRGLRTKIIAWSFVPTMIILIAVAVIIFYAYEDVTEDLVIERNRDLARLTSSQLVSEMREYGDVLEAEARVLQRHADDLPGLRRALAEASNRLAVFDGGALLLDTFGTVVASEPERPETLGQDWSDRAYYRELIRAEVPISAAPVFSDIVADGPDSSEVVAVAVGIADPEGKFVGVIAGMFRVGATTVSAFYGDIVKLHIGDSGNAYLVDGNGRAVYHTITGRIADDLSEHELVQRVLSGQADAVRTVDSDGQSVVASFAPVPGTPWGLVTEESWAAVIGSSRGYQNILLALLALGVLVPTLIVMVGVGRIMRPIAEVIDGAREIAAGHFGHRIVVRTGDELEDMAEQFNAMAGALEESYSNLEQRVEERTQGERRRADQLRAINEVGRRISSVLSLDELLPHVARSLQETFKYHNVSILLLDHASGALLVKASAGALGEARSDVAASAAPDGVAGSVAKTGELLLVADVNQDSRFRRSESPTDTRSELAVPIKIGDDTVGVLHIEEARPDAFDELDVFSVQTLADQLSVAIENARLYEQAQEVAMIGERQRLARDLHDAVTQTLFSASIIAEVLPRLWERDPADGQLRLEELRQLTRGALAEMRMLLLELRPAALTEVGLGELLRQLAQAVSARSRLPIALDVEGQCAMPPDVQVTLYRIAQESVNNVVKHAGATQASMGLHCQPAQVELTIEDDGRGFDPQSVSPEHLGIGIMRERAESIGAEIRIESQVGRGTRVVVVWADAARKE